MSPRVAVPLLAAALLLLPGCFYGPAWDASSGSSPAASEADAAQSDVLAAIPALEAYYADHGSYRGLQHVDEVYGVSLGDVRIAVLKRGAAYCVEAPRGAPAAHFVGPAGPLADGPC